MTTSTSSAASASLASLTIASACNPDKLELVEVKIENIDGKKEKIKALPDTGANITAFEPEILLKLGLSVDNLVKETKVPKSADGSVLRTLGSVQVRISKSGRTTEFVMVYIIKNLQQPILSRQAFYLYSYLHNDDPCLLVVLHGSAWDFYCQLCLYVSFFYVSLSLPSISPKPNLTLNMPPC